jgi:hypothetical protein
MTIQDVEHVVPQEPHPDRIEAPVTIKGYLMCAFAAFGGIFFGYDSGYISGQVFTVQEVKSQRFANSCIA